ncbi:MAG TPA: hypothetical protein PLS93_10825 [Accumulibacter sp.]|nr:hypothetical protein [Accumulibacter sp.]
MNHIRARRALLRQISGLAASSAVVCDVGAKSHSTQETQSTAQIAVGISPSALVRDDKGETAWARIRINDRILRKQLPEPFLGFNINFLNFQEAFFGPDSVHPEVISHLRMLPGCTYRYPGGLVANTFDWEGAVGSMSTRRQQLNLERMPPAPVRFGPAEYLQFCESVHGRAFYVLNLVGWNAQRRSTEMPTANVTASNRRLAEWRRTHEANAQFRYYQLGNELDRSDYEWPHSKYIERCRASMDAILTVDPQARFIAFLRDFNWRYRGRAGVSRAEDFARDVLRGLPDLDGYSLNVYYDSPREDRTTDIPHRLRAIKQTVEAVRSLTSGRAGLWITEHARQLPKDQRAGSMLDTSGIDGAISSADFILSMASLPELKGMFWHAVGSGKWSLFSVEGSAVTPTPVYWAMRMLHSVSQGEILDSITESSNRSAYAGGYDCRALAFGDAGRDTLRVALINRHSSSMQARLLFRPWAQRSAVVSMSYVSDTAQSQRARARMEVELVAGTPDTRVRLGPEGDLISTIPPRSVCIIKLALSN